MATYVIDIEQSGNGGTVCRRSSAAAATDDGTDSQAYSDPKEGGGRGGVSSSSDDDEILGGSSRRGGRKSSSISEDCSVDLENGELEKKVHLVKKVKRDCRICQLSMDSSDPTSGTLMELGCSCKDDLAAAHKHCAEAWFKLRGNKTCEICGSTAHNVVGVNDIEAAEQSSEANDAGNEVNLVQNATETRRFWQGHKFLNFLLACMVFAFVISWLFHFNVPS